MSIKIIETTEPAETNQDDKMPSKNSMADTSLKFKPIRFSRRIKKGFKVSRLNERAAQDLEKYIPKLAKAATTRAYRRALNSGSKVLIAEDGQLMEVLPNGTKRAVRKIEPSVKMRKGQIIKIK